MARSHNKKKGDGRGQRFTIHIYEPSAKCIRKEDGVGVRGVGKTRASAKEEVSEAVITEDMEILEENPFTHKSQLPKTHTNGQISKLVNKDEVIETITFTTHRESSEELVTEKRQAFSNQQAIM